MYTRKEFDKNSLIKDPKEIETLLKVADQASIIITRNIVQGIQNKDSIFSLQLNPIKEMNDNSSIKKSKQGQPPQKI